VKLLIDMNLTPEWVLFFMRGGLVASHWSTVGDPRATDREIMEYARENSFVVFTHDLDFGNILAVTSASAPSVVQVRTQDPTPESIGEIVIASLRAQDSLLQSGALVVVEPHRLRARILPLTRRSTEDGD